MASRMTSDSSLMEEKKINSYSYKNLAYSLPSSNSISITTAA
jgi:hypothetical protein